MRSRTMPLARDTPEETVTRSRPAALLSDPQFALALALGPVVWLAAIAALGAPVDPGWILSDPFRYMSLALAWPLIEEWLFRGVLQPALVRTAWGRRKSCGISAANAATSFAFAAAHLVSHAPAWAAMTFVPSLVFGYFRDRHNSMTPSAILHVFYNAGWFLFLGM